MNVLGGILMASGVFFLVAGTIGYVRLPDFYCRMHATGKADTLGALLSLLGAACVVGWSLLALKFVVIALFVFVANPTATHAVARAGLLSGVMPWTRKNAP